MGLAFAIWAGLILIGTNYPFQFDVRHVAREWGRFLGHPRYTSWSDIFVNIAIFIPFGVFFFLALPRQADRVVRFLIVGFSAGLFSVALELAQLTQLVRSTSVLDVLSNGFGSGCGALVGWHLEIRVALARIAA